MIIGAIGAVAHGVALPCMIIVFGDMLDSFTSTGDICKFCNSTSFTAIQGAFYANTSKNFTCDTYFNQQEKDLRE